MSRRAPGGWAAAAGGRASGWAESTRERPRATCAPPARERGVAAGAAPATGAHAVRRPGTHRRFQSISLSSRSSPRTIPLHRTTNIITPSRPPTSRLVSRPRRNLHYRRMRMPQRIWWEKCGRITESCRSRSSTKTTVLGRNERSIAGRTEVRLWRSLGPGWLYQLGRRYPLSKGQLLGKANAASWRRGPLGLGGRPVAVGTQ